MNASELNKALAWVDRNIQVPLTEPQKAGVSLLSAHITSVPENASLLRFINASILVTVKGHVKQSAGG